MIEWSIIGSTEELRALRAPWEALHAGASAPYFLGFDFCLAAWDAVHRPAGASLAHAAAFESGRLAAVLPMVLKRRRLWTVATACSPLATDESDVLVRPGADRAMLADGLFRTLLAVARPDIVEVRFVRAGSSLDQAVQASAGSRIVKIEREGIPYARLHEEADWASYAGSLEADYRRKIERAARRLGKEGRIEFHVAEDLSASDAAWLFAQKRKWAERTSNLGPWVFSDAYRAFLQAVFDARIGFRAFTLIVGSRLAAMKIVALDGTAATGVIGAFDEAFKQGSPGLVLDEMVTRHVFERHRTPDGGRLDFNFGPGLERPKLHWSRGHVLPCATYRIAPSWWGLLGSRVQQRLRRGERVSPARGALSVGTSGLPGGREGT